MTKKEIQNKEQVLVLCNTLSFVIKNPPLAPPSRLEDRRQGGESDKERLFADNQTMHI